MAHLRNIAKAKKIVWLVALVGALSLIASIAFAQSRPPAPRITSRPRQLTKSIVRFGFNDAQRSVTFKCKLDGSGYRTCTSPTIYRGLAHTRHKFFVRAIDRSGTQSSSAQLGFTVHATPPSVALSFPADGGIYNVASWSSGCPKVGVCGSVSDVAGVSSVQVSVKQSSTGKYWTGNKFSSSSEKYNAASVSSPRATNATWSFGLPLPADGGYTVHVIASDRLGNTTATPVQAILKIDTVAPPAPSITAKPPTLSNSTSASFSFADSEKGVTFRCRLDNGSYGPCASPSGYAALAQGAHTFQVQALDQAGNASSTGGYSWTVDSVSPPQPTISSHPTSSTTLTSASFSFTDSERGVTFQCQRDGSAWQGCTSPNSYTGLSGGQHTFQVRALDTAGNASTPASFNWTVGQPAPPQPTITQTPANPVASTSATLAFTDSQPGVTYQCSIDNAAFSTCSSPKSYGGLAQGSHTFQVEAVDSANQASVPKSYTWVVDTVAPPIPSITQKPTDPARSTSATFAFSDTETTAKLECSIDNAAFGACASPKTYAALGQGRHTFQVRAHDDLGNASSASSYSWTVDTTPPATPTIGTGPANPTTSTSAQLTFSDTESGVTFECKLDTGDFLPCSTPASYARLADGSHTFQVHAIDQAGNVSDAADYAWTQDSTPPADPTIDSKPTDPVASTDATFAFSDSEPTATFECSLDNVAFAKCASPKIYTGLGQGRHTFKLRALDAVGNATAPISYSWTVDTVAPPAPTIDAHPDNPTLDTAGQFKFTDTDPTAILQCQIDGSAFTTCTSPAAYTVGVGAHTFAVRATDTLGNASDPAGYAWTVQKLADFSISGDAPSTLYPGADPQPIDLSISNPNDFAITVTSLNATVAATGETGCQTDWFTVTPAQLPATGIPVPAHGTISLPAQGASSPTLQMQDAGVNQDACKGAKLTLSYTGSAQS